MRELKALDITTIALGELIEEANRVLGDMVDHCTGHPSLKKARTVRIEINLEPEYDEDLDDFSVKITHFVVPLAPKMRGRADRAKRQADGTFVVAGSPHVHTLEPKQMNIHELRPSAVDS
jgi:hypothetical protein